MASILVAFVSVYDMHDRSALCWDRRLQSRCLSFKPMTSWCFQHVPNAGFNMCRMLVLQIWSACVKVDSQREAC